MAQPPPKNAIVDAKTGIITPEWLQWLHALSGGTGSGDGSGSGGSGGSGGGSGGGDGGGGSGGGDVTIVNDYGSGTVGKITKWIGVQSLGDSIMSEDGNTITISGNIVAQNLGGAGGGTVFLGATSIEWVQSDVPVAWVPASGIQFINHGRKTGTVFVRLRARAGSVQARLLNVSDGLIGGIGTPVTSTTFVTVSFPVTLVEGKTYELQLLPEVAGVDVQGIGYLE